MRSRLIPHFFSESVFMELTCFRMSLSVISLQTDTNSVRQQIMLMILPCVVTRGGWGAYVKMHKCKNEGNRKIMKTAQLCRDKSSGSWKYITRPCAAESNFQSICSHISTQTRCRHTIPLIIFCISLEHVSLAPVVAVCSATLSVSSLYFNPHGHADTVFFILSTATARVGSVMPLHFAKRSAQRRITMAAMMAFV